MSSAAVGEPKCSVCTHRDRKGTQYRRCRATRRLVPDCDQTASNDADGVN